MINQKIKLVLFSLLALTAFALAPFGAGLAGTSHAAGIVIGTGSTLDAGTATITVPGNITINGTLNGSQGTIQLTGNWEKATKGIFNCGTGTVEFIGNSGTSRNIRYSTDFYNLRCTSEGLNLIFEANYQQTIKNKLTLAGTSGNLIKLISSIPGSYWIIWPYLYDPAIPTSDATGSREVSYVNVKDSWNKRGGATTPGKTTQYVIYANNSTDESSNSNIDWSFSGIDLIPPQVTVEAPATGESWPANTSQNIRFTCTDESGIKSNSANLYYSTSETTAWVTIETNAPITQPVTIRPWSVPNIPTTEARIKVTVQDNSPSQNTGTGISGKFSIVVSSFESLSISREGNTPGSAIRISWTSSSTPDVYALYGDGTGQYVTAETTWNKVTNPTALGYQAYNGYLLHLNQVGGGSPEAYYKALAPGASNTLLPSAEAVGKFDITLPVGLSLISVPLIPASSEINSAIGNQLSNNDKIFNFTGSAWINSTLIGGNWSGGITNILPDLGYWTVIQSLKTVTIVGSVPNSPARTIELISGLSLKGSSYPAQVSIESSGLSEALLYPASGTGIIYYFTGSAWKSSTWNGTAWVNKGIPYLQPKCGYWIKRNNSDSSTWNYPRPY